jgi:hypothetical protein
LSTKVAKAELDCTLTEHNGRICSNTCGRFSGVGGIQRRGRPMADGQRDYLRTTTPHRTIKNTGLVRRWMKTEPLPFFKQLREQRPILVTPECTLVTLYSDLTDVMQMPKVFTVDLTNPRWVCPRRRSAT